MINYFLIQETLNSSSGVSKCDLMPLAKDSPVFSLCILLPDMFQWHGNVVINPVL